MSTVGTTLPGTGTSPAAATSPGGKDAIRPFHVEFSDDVLADLRRRVVAMRWPPKELVADQSQGVPLATLQKLARYRAADYDWRLSSGTRPADRRLGGSVRRTRKSAPNRTGFPGTAARSVVSFPRQKHQVGRFLCVPEKRLARRAHFRTHGQTIDKVNDLARPRGYRKVRRDFSRADRVPEATFHHRHGASGCAL